MPEGHDPFAPPKASPRGAPLSAGIGLALGVLAALSGGAAMLVGPVGMGFGLIGHAKGSRLGMPAAIVAAIGTIVGMSVHFLLR